MSATQLDRSYLLHICVRAHKPRPDHLPSLFVGPLISRRVALLICLAQSSEFQHCHVDAELLWDFPMELGVSTYPTVYLGEGQVRQLAYRMSCPCRPHDETAFEQQPADHVTNPDHEQA